MFLSIPTVKWSVCWPCREYFKTTKGFQNHKLTIHGNQIKETKAKDDEPEKESVLKNSVVPAAPVWRDSENHVTIVEPEVKSVIQEVHSSLSITEQSDADLSKPKDAISNASMEDQPVRSPGYTLRNRVIIPCFRNKKRFTFSTSGNSCRTSRKRAAKEDASAEPPKLNIHENVKPVKRSRKTQISEDIRNPVPTDTALTNSRKSKVDAPIKASTQRIPTQVRPKEDSKHAGINLRVRNQSVVTKPKKALAEKKSFRCQVCGKSFFGLRVLQRHEQTHAAEKPLNCINCGKPAMQKNTSLKRISRLSVSKKSVSCRFCGRRFNAV